MLSDKRTGEMTVYMITLNDYLYSGDTLLRILRNYSEDLRKDARKNKNEIDLAHCNFLLQDVYKRQEYSCR